MKNHFQIYLCGTPDMPVDYELLCDLAQTYGFSADLVLGQLVEGGFCVTGTPLTFRAERIDSKPILTPTSPDYENTVESFLAKSWEYEKRMANGCL